MMSSFFEVPHFGKVEEKILILRWPMGCFAAQATRLWFVWSRGPVSFDLTYGLSKSARKQLRYGKVFENSIFLKFIILEKSRKNFLLPWLLCDAQSIWDYFQVTQINLTFFSSPVSDNDVIETITLELLIEKHQLHAHDNQLFISKEQVLKQCFDWFGKSSPPLKA